MTWNQQNLSSVKRRQQACAFGSTRSLLWSVSHSCTGGLCRHTCQLQVWAPGNGFSKVKSDTSGCPGASMDEADPWLCHVGTGCDVPLSPSPSLITAGDVHMDSVCRGYLLFPGNKNTFLFAQREKDPLHFLALLEGSFMFSLDLQVPRRWETSQRHSSCHSSWISRALLFSQPKLSVFWALKVFCTFIVVNRKRILPNTPFFSLSFL